MKKKIIAFLCVAAIMASICSFGAMAQALTLIPLEPGRTFFSFFDINKNPQSHFTISANNDVVTLKLDCEKFNKILKEINYPIKEIINNTYVYGYYICSAKLKKVDKNFLYFSTVTETRIQTYAEKKAGKKGKTISKTDKYDIKVDYNIAGNSISFTKIHMDALNQTNSINDKINMSFLAAGYYKFSKHSTSGNYLNMEFKADLDAFANKVVQLVNIEREKAGLKPIEKSSALTKVAKIRAKEIVTSFSHNRPDGRVFYTAYKENGVSYTYAGENIASGQQSPEKVMESWMNSPGHRGNILNTKYGRIGIGVAIDKNGVLYWVQNFAN